MSIVSNYALFLTMANDDTDSHSGELAAGVNVIHQHLRRTGIKQEFARVDQHSGGAKAWEASCFMMGANWISLKRVADAILSVEWEDPRGVMLVMLGQEDEEFRAYTLSQLRDLKEDRY